MAPTILIAGATGNTGKGVVETLPALLASHKALSGYRILALTRSASSPTAKEFAKLPGVEVLEKNWVEIDTEWLKEHGVVRAFIASHNQPNQFSEESNFHCAALNADVEYVVRISTTAANVHPNCRAYYPRTHWAIETMLSQPEFAALNWTSLQPNVFLSYVLAPAAKYIKSYGSENGKPAALRLMLNQDTPVGVVDAHDVGLIAAHLLAQTDVSVHNKAKYVLNGPEDLTGKQVVSMVEQHTGSKVEQVIYQDTSYVADMVSQSNESKTVIGSLKYALETAWAGECMASTTSKAILQLAAPKGTAGDALKALLS